MGGVPGSIVSGTGTKKQRGGKWSCGGRVGVVGTEIVFLRRLGGGEHI